MSALNKNAISLYNTNKKSNNKSNKINKLIPKNVTLKKKSCSSNNIKNIKEDTNIKYNNTTKINQYNKIHDISNSNKKAKNKINKIPKKKEQKQKSNNIINQNKIQNIKDGNIDSYPSIISTDTLTLKNNNINISKKNATEHIFSFINFNNKVKKDSFSSNNLINSNNNFLLQNKENKNKNNNQKNNIIHQKYLSDLTTDQKNDNAKRFSKSELNEIKRNYNRLSQNYNSKDMDKIKIDIKFENISTINEIDSSLNNIGQKNIKNKEYVEPEFIQEIKEKNFFKINNNLYSERNKKDSFNIHLNYNSNTENNHKIKNFNKYNLENISNSNNIMNYLTYFKDKENDNYYILSPINSTFKQINSRKSNHFGKLFGNHKKIEEINEDDIDTVKQENTFGGSKIESMTSETFKEIQIPKKGKYFFDIPEEEQNYNYIQGPIEFEYDNSSGKITINNKEDINDNNCSKLNDINMYKLERKVIIDDGNAYYYDIMKENEDLKENVINNNNNIYSSISSNNEKTISNNCSFNNININKISSNKLLNEVLINKGNFNKILSGNENNKEKTEMQIYKKVNSYQKKIIKGSFDFNKPKTFKASTKINQNFSETKKKQILLYRLKNYKINFFFDILEKVIKNHKRKIFNKFLNINYRINKLFNIFENIYIYKNKENFIKRLFKYIDKGKEFPLFLPNKIYPSNQNNCNILNIDSNIQIENFGNDNETLNNSCNIYYENNISSIIKNNLTQNEVSNNSIKNKFSSEKTDSYFYEKKLFHSKNTIPFANINYSDKNEYYNNKKIINQKKNLNQKNYKQDFEIPNKNMFIYRTKLSNTNTKNNLIKIDQSEKTDDSNINNQKSYKSNNIENKEEDILEQAYKFKFLDEERCSNGNYHRNIKSELEDSENKKLDTLKAYFFKEFEKLQFPNINDNKNNLRKNEEM